MRTLRGVSSHDQQATGDHFEDSSEAGSSTEAPSPDGPRHPIVLYTLARIALLLVTAGLLYLVGARSWLLVLLALIISGLVSYLVLGSLRDAMSTRMDRRMAAARERREAATRAEDDLY